MKKLAVVLVLACLVVAASGCPHHHGVVRWSPAPDEAQPAEK